MDLKEAWKNLEKEKLSIPVAGTFSVPRNSKHPVANIINTFAMGLVFCVFFALVFVALFFATDQTIVKVGLLVTVVAYGILFIINLRVLQQLKRLHHSDENVLKVLNGVHSIVTQTIRFQQKFSLGFFPVCVTTGFLLGVSITKDAAAMMVRPKFYLSLIVMTLIFTPISYYVTKWLTKLSHGKYLKQIEELIAQAKAD